MQSKEPMPSHLAKISQRMQDPAFYPHGATAVEMRETHISLVFLTGDYVYKLKKPVDLGFLDFSTLDRRRVACENEVELNGRLSHNVYEGVVAVTQKDGRYALQGNGPAVEYAVMMRQLPEERTLHRMIERGQVDASAIDVLARVLERFYRRAARSETIDGFGAPAVISGNCEENFSQTLEFVGSYVDEGRFDSIAAATRSFIAHRADLFEKRRAARQIRDGHGDLRSGHIYFTDQGVQIIDCIEFNERFRYGDSANDLAFLSMDLDAHESAHTARLLIDAYVRHSSDLSLYAVLSFYKCYRAMVRVKVDCMRLRQGGLNTAEQEKLRQKVTRYTDLAYLYAMAFSRPKLWVVCGWIAAGKSTLAAGLSEALGLRVLSTDVIRREMFRKTGADTGQVAFETGAYTPQATALTYGNLLSLAQEELRRGRSVILDATFSRAKQRQELLRLAADWHVQPFFVFCSCDEAVIQKRLKAREGAEGVSQARIEHWQAFKRKFENLDDIPADRVMAVDTLKPAELVLASILNRYAYA